MRVLLAGGTNFIGRTIASQLAVSHQVTVLNRGSTPAPSGVAAHAVADRTCGDSVRKALRDHRPFDAVVDVSATDPSHVRGLLAGMGNDVPASYVLISSAAVYSPDAPYPRTEDAPADGDPAWGGYGELKAACEHELRASGLENLTVLRPPYIYGPGNNEQREQWLWARILGRHPIFLPGTGRTEIQFCFVKHLADMVEAAVAGTMRAGVYNVGEARTYSMLEYVTLLAEVCGYPARLMTAPDSDVPARSYFPFRDMPMALAMDLLVGTGAPAGPDLRTGLAATWGWFRSNGLPGYVPTEQERRWSQRDD